MGVAAELASFAANLDISDVPSEVLLKVKSHVLDQLGAQLACSSLPWNQAVYRYGKKHARQGLATVVGAGDQLDAEYAGLINGTAGHGFEIDDYHPAIGHPGCVAVSSALAVGEEEGSSGAEFLLAATLGFEIISRVALATMPSMTHDRGFHASCAEGVFGAAVGAARLMDLPEDILVNAISIAGSHASSTTEYAQSGGDVKRLHAGMGTAGGIRAARIAAMGMTGPATIMEGRKGFLQAFSADPHPERLTEGLGARWELMDTALKPYCCCGLIIPQIDALRRIIRDNAIAAPDIEEIRVGTDRFSLVHVGTIGPEPRDMIGAQFSSHYTLAMTVVGGRNDFTAYLDASEMGFADPATLALSRRVRLELDEECDGEFPTKWLAKVAVKTTDGRNLVAKSYPRGSSQDPLSQNEVQAKFTGLAGSAMPSDQAARIAELIWNIEACTSIRELSQLLVTPAGWSRSRPNMS